MTLINRRQILATGALASPAALLPTGRCQAAPDKRRNQQIPREVQKAIDSGLAFLGGQQISSGRARGSFGRGGHAGGVAVCGLAGLAFMSNGNPPDQGPYGEKVDRCLDFIVNNTSDRGYISSPGGRDNMYGHGFATLFLSQAYGMTNRKDVGEKLRAAIKLIIETQNDQGGWRYQPTKSSADLSITICQVMALRAAANAGIKVPKATRDKTIDYIKKSQNPDGGFRYTLSSSRSSFPLTAAGLVSLYSAGIYEGEIIDRGLKHLQTFKPGGSTTSSSYYFYAHYYAVQAMWHAGGDYWEKWYPAICKELVPARQQSNGSWTDSVGPQFGTAMACIILGMPNNYLPIFEP